MKSYQFTPWRIEYSEECGWQVWTARDDRPGSLNNYVIADGIQSEDEARLLAASPQLYSLLYEMIVTARRAAIPGDEPSITVEFFKRARALLWNLDKPQSNA